jgi:predicted dehydrogenase
MSKAELKVALVGCGQIADAHLQEIPHAGRAAVVAVCDRHKDLADQAAGRFGVGATYGDVGLMLAEARPDVVHITTPPQSHRPLALQALAAGANVYVEKPFAVDLDEAESILSAAEANGRLVCVGHDQLLDPVWLECKRRIGSGEIGRVVHVESIQGYDMRGPFGRAIATDPDHWVRRLPGGLFQNVMSHALYRITDLIPGPAPRVWADWFGGEDSGALPTELRVALRWPDATGSLVFSSAARPVRRVARVLGTHGGIEVDLDIRTLRRDPSPGLPGAFAKVEGPLRQLAEAARNSARSVRQFARYEQSFFLGMRGLFAAFYKAILDGSAPPIPYGEIRRDTAIMDAAFARCRRGWGDEPAGVAAEADGGAFSHAGGGGS